MRISDPTIFLIKRIMIPHSFFWRFRCVYAFADIARPFSGAKIRFDRNAVM